jgi:hypothetical protein
VPLLSSFAIRAHRLGIVLRNADTAAVAETERELGTGVPLLSGFATPAHALGVVARQSVSLREFVLGRAIASGSFLLTVVIIASARRHRLCGAR